MSALIPKVKKTLVIEVGAYGRPHPHEAAKWANFLDASQRSDTTWSLPRV
jgi:hypothetical protein